MIDAGNPIHGMGVGLRIPLYGAYHYISRVCLKKLSFVQQLVFVSILKQFFFEKQHLKIIKYVVCLILFISLSAQEYMRVCYYTNWAQYRRNGMQFFPEDVDPFLCTHIKFAFAQLNGNRLATYEWNDNEM